MSTIVTRAGKGSPLTNTEVDSNFTNLNTDKIEAGTTVTLTNKTLTSPKINEILDTSGNEILGLSPTASATDFLTVKNGIGTGVPLHVYADGPSTNIGLHIQPKGSGLVTISDGTDFNKGIRFRSSSSAASAVTLIDAVSTAGRVVTLPDATTTLVGRDTTDTLTNKTIAFSSNTFSGTLAIANGGTGQATANAALNALLPAQTGNASKYLQTNGTDSSWDAISLSTADITGTLGTANGGTGLTSFTSGGLVYASSSSALATNSALTWTGSNLFSTGSITLDTNLGVFFSGSGATTAGVYGRESGTTVAFNASGAEGMRLTSTGLGIGTSSPAYKLDVNGTSNITTTASGSAGAILGYQAFSAGILGNHDTADAWQWKWAVLGASGGGGTGLNTRFSLLRSVKSQATDLETLTVDSLGNLGLGVVPSAWSSSYKALQLTGGAVQSYSTGYISVGQNNYDSGTNAWKYVATGPAYATRYQQGDGAHQWFIAPSGTAGNAISFTQAMTLEADGDLALGKTSASYRFDLQGAAGENQTLAGFFSGTNTARGLTLGLSAGGTGANDAFAVYNATLGGGYSGHIWQAGGAEQARISQNGYFGIATNNPLNLLHVASASGDKVEFLRLQSTSGFNAAGGSFIRAGSSSTNTVLFGFDYDSLSFQVQSGVGTALMTVQTGGNVGIGTTTPKIEAQVKSSGGIQAVNADEIALRYNVYYDGADRYIQAANKAASVVLNSSGNILFYNTNTASTSANSTVTGWGERARIDSSGVLTINSGGLNLGAGGVNGYISGGTWYGINAGNWNFQGGNASQDFVWKNSSASSLMTLKSGGQLLVGDTTGNGVISARNASAALVEIKTTAGTNYAALEIINGSGGVYIGKDNSAGSFFGSGTAYSAAIYSYGAHPLVFFTNGTERMRITSGDQLQMVNGVPSKIDALRGSGFGYSPASYGALIVGATSGNTTVCINVDPIANASGAFSGTGIEVMFRNVTQFITPNAANTGFKSLLQLNDGNVVVNNNLSIGTSGTGSGLGLYLARGVTTNFLEAFDGTKTFIGGTDSANGYVKVGSLSAHPVAIVQNNGPAIYIDTSKNVLVGGTSQTAGGEKFLVQNFVDANSAVAVGIHAGAVGNKDINFYGAGNSQFFTAARIRVKSQYYTDEGNMSFWTTSNNGANVLTTSEKMVILANGNVGINHTVPNTKLDIKGDTTTYGGMAKIYLTDSNSEATSRNWSIGNGGSAFGALTFAVSATKDGNPGDGAGYNALVLNKNGAVSLFGANVSANGVGLVFPATQSASSDANTLDDYEEGTWTPVATATTGPTGVTYNYQGGWYRKIGSLVVVGYGINIASVGTGGSGELRIVGFPFTSGLSGSYREPSSAMQGGRWVTSALAGQTYLFIIDNTTMAGTRYQNNADTQVNWSEIQGGNLSTGTYFNGTLSYFVD